MSEEEKIDVKIVTPIEYLWHRVKREAEFLIKQSEESLIIQREMLKLAEQKISEENGK